MYWLAADVVAAEVGAGLAAVVVAAVCAGVGVAVACEPEAVLGWAAVAEVFEAGADTERLAVGTVPQPADIAVADTIVHLRCRDHPSGRRRRIDQSARTLRTELATETFQLPEAAPAEEQVVDRLVRVWPVAQESADPAAAGCLMPEVGAVRVVRVSEGAQRHEIYRIFLISRPAVMWVVVGHRHFQKLAQVWQAAH